MKKIIIVQYLTRRLKTMMILFFSKEQKMILTQSQGERLKQILLASRPDWDDRGVTKILQDANRANGLPAHNFDHAIRAAASYSTSVTSLGDYSRKTPAFYPATGTHWDSTAPASSKHTKHRGAPCEDHIGQEASTCRSCRADILLGHRPEHMQGKRLAPGDPSPPPPPGWRKARSKEN